MVHTPPELQTHGRAWGPQRETGRAGWPVHGGRILTLPVASQSLAQMVKRLPAVRETQVQSLDWEDSLEKEMATHSTILAWRIPWMEEPGQLQPMGWQRVRHD